jgi:hypothetical protein
VTEVASMRVRRPGCRWGRAAEAHDPQRHHPPALVVGQVLLQIVDNDVMSPN